MSAKGKKIEAGTGTELVPASLNANGKKSSGIVMALVEKALLGATTTVQAIQQLEVVINEAAVACLAHAEKYGDIMPAHRLVTGLPKHPSMRTIQSELVHWFRINSPVWWDAKGEPHLAKEGEPNFKPFDTEGAEAEAFNETEGAQSARKAALSAHKRKLSPGSVETLRGRFWGIRNYVAGLAKPNDNGDIAGFKSDEDKKQMVKIVKQLEDFAINDLGWKEPDNAPDISGLAETATTKKKKAA